MPTTLDRVSASGRQADFVERHSAAAQAVARDSGIPAAFMLGQAGHESGWGRGEIRHADGSPAHNLFGIKATSGWNGKVAEVTTTFRSGRGWRKFSKSPPDHTRFSPAPATRSMSSPSPGLVMPIQRL